MYDRRLIARARRLRRAQTPHEGLLWSRLRARQLFCERFLRQYPIEGCIVDFYAPRLKLAVELDGGQHFDPEGLARDTARDAGLARAGVTVLRISNGMVRSDLEGAVALVQRAVREARERSGLGEPAEP